MKTKHILTAMVLPTLLAACTADEIVENNNNAISKNRAQVEAVSFNAEGSRLAYENGAWAWEGTDKFLLLQADGGYNDTTKDALPGERFSAGVPSTGYEYAKAEDGMYKTAAAVMEEGLYWGYAPSFNKTYKGYVKFDLPTSQYMHVKGQEDTYKNEELAALITPLYEVSALNEDTYNSLPLSMINFYSTLMMPLKNNTEEDITINQIVFETANPITVAGRIKTEAMAGFIMASDNEEWAPAVNFDDDDENDYDDQADMLKAMAKTNLIAAYDKTKGDKQTSAIVLNLDGYVLKAGKTENFYMLVPAVEEITYSITVVAKEGLVEVKSSFASNSMIETEINHNSTKAAFGKTNKDAARAYVIDEKDFTDIKDAYYVTDEVEMMRILDEDVNGTISVYNVGDWGIGADLAKAIKNSDTFVIFENDITVEGAALSAEKAMKLTKVSFKKNVTVVEDTKVDFDLGQYDDEDGDVENAFVNDMVIEEGAVVTLTSGAYKEINSKGTLNVTSTATMTAAEIKTASALNLKDNNAKSINLVAGTLNYKTAKTGTNVWETSDANLTVGALTANAEIIVDANVVLTHDAANIGTAWRTLKPNSTTAYYTTSVTNKGKIILAGTQANNTYLNGDLHVYGTLTNEGKITSSSNTLHLYASSENKAGALIETFQFVNYKGAELDNYGKLLSATGNLFNINRGLITAYSGSRTEIDGALKDGEAATAEVVGRINNSNHGVVVLKNNVEQIVYAEFGNVTVAELEAEEYDTWAINTLRVTNSLEMNRAFDPAKAADALGLAALTRLELGNDASVFVKNKKDATSGLYVPVQISFAEIILEGNAEIYGDTEESSNLVIDNVTSIQMYNKAQSSTSDKSCYTLKLDNVTVTANHNLTFAKTIDKGTPATGCDYNLPKVVLEDATLCGNTTLPALSETAALTWTYATSTTPNPFQ